MTEVPARDLEQLDAAILRAHEVGDLPSLAALYAEAGGREAARGAMDPACFFWTQAWIFALDAGADGLAGDLEARLREAGRLGPTAGPEATRLVQRFPRDRGYGSG